MAVRIQDLRDPIGEPEVQAAEAALGYTLPEPYRSFLLLHNGGSPEPAAFTVLDPLAGEKIIGRVNERYECDELPRMMGLYRGRIPPDLLPIGDDDDGNQILLRVRGPGVGRVYLWDYRHEHAPPTHGNVALLADRFDLLLGRLFDDLR
jgi:hypothetical protein